MALVVDAVPLFLDHVWRQLKPVRDALLAVGFLYTVKKVAVVTKDACVGLKVFGASRIFHDADFPTRYGAKWAVVTGCTSRIGERFVHELAKRGLNIVLVARDGDKLAQLQFNIESEYGVKTIISVVDFSQGHSAIAGSGLEDTLRDKDIGVLVNNVTIGPRTGHPQFFDEQEVAENWDLVNVNLGSTLEMTRLVLPQMQARRKGAIINMGSVFGDRPMPLMSTYSASKAFMRYWTKSLEVELRPYHIDVLLLEPSFAVGTALTTLTPKLIMPSAQTYASHAIQTLGWTNHTSGYWPQSLETYMFGFLFRIPDTFIKLGMLRLRNSGPNVTPRAS